MLAPSPSRRAFSAAALGAAIAGGPSLPALSATESLAQRLATPRAGALELTRPGTASKPDTLHYPGWLLGTWRVTNAIVAFSMPLGSVFVDEFTQQSGVQRPCSGCTSVPVRLSRLL